MRRSSNLRGAIVIAAMLATSVATNLLRADDPPPAPPKRSGEDIYLHICQACHMPDGKGAQGAGTYPALAGNPRLESAQYTATTVFFGRRNMPHFGPQPGLGAFEEFVVVHLDDAEIAAVVNYVRSHFDNHYTDELTAADVAALHSSR